MGIDYVILGRKLSTGPDGSAFYSYTLYSMEIQTGTSNGLGYTKNERTTASVGKGRGEGEIEVKIEFG